ncbi:ScbR family autoregulator-binding transcription factor [Streptomyces sp. NPDC005485]|uniref:ScbR family autoregulator-binding transcription factor n=1 Tax=Streptomyces sp. NPDC005485 TaxID=3155591 RepID=UPI0033B2F321
MVKQARAARTRQALINAAAEVFADDGYALASLPAISKRAGVSTGALHFHFPSKDLLAREVEAAAVESVERLAQQGRVRDRAGLQLLVDVSCELMLAVSADIVLRAGFELGGDPSRKNEEGPGRWWSDWVYRLLCEADGAGELAEGVSPEGAAAAVVAATVGFGVLNGWRRVRFSPQLVEQFWVLMLPGLAASPAGVLVVSGASVGAAVRGDN